MSNDNYLNLIANALPREVTLDRLKLYGKEEWWLHKPQLAVAYALRKSRSIDWEKYNIQNPDIAAANIDPCLHFMKHGLYEGRILPGKMPQKSVMGQTPDISVIIPSYNNASYLSSCFKSVQNQTLSNIEIIVVDDGSSDESLQIIREYVAQDQRIVLICHKENQSLHMARKTGVAAATGDYVMFLDSDDSLEPEACETALAAIKPDYDVVCFCANIKPGKKGIKTGSIDRWVNTGLPAGEYTQAQFLDSVFKRNIQSFHIWNKIYSREVIQTVFAELEDGYFKKDEDLYEFLAILLKTDKILKIADPLYNYYFGRGISGNPIMVSDAAPVLTALQRYCALRNLTPYYEIIKSNLLANTWRIAFSSLNEIDAPQFLSSLATDYGRNYLLQWLLASPASTRREFWSKSTRLAPRERPNSSKIAIFVDSNCGLVKYRLLEQLGENLMRRGMELAIYVTQTNYNYIPKLKGVTYYRAPMNKNKIGEYLGEFLEEWEPGLGIHFSSLSPSLESALLACELYDVPLYAIEEADYTRFLKKAENAEIDRISLFLRLTKYICFDKQSCNFWLCNGVAAALLPAPFALLDDAATVPPHSAWKGIFIIGPVGDQRTQAPLAMEIFAGIKREFNDLKLVYICNTGAMDHIKNLWLKADKLGLSSCVEFINYADFDPAFCAAGSLILDCGGQSAFSDGFALAVARHVPYLALGMYDQSHSVGVSHIPYGDMDVAIQEGIRLMRQADAPAPKSPCSDWLERLTTAITNPEAGPGENLFVTRKELEEIIKNITTWAGKSSPRSLKLVEDFQKTIADSMEPLSNGC